MLFADLKWELMWIKVMYIQSIYIFLFDFATQIPSYSGERKNMNAEYFLLPAVPAV